MLTRRTVLRAGLAFTAVASAPVFGVPDPNAGRHRPARAIDALLIDETIAMPREVSTFIDAGRRTWPVVGIPLDAASHAALMRVLGQSQDIVGISSGATLFCLERMAWDQGLRLTERHSWRAADPIGDTAWPAVAALLGGAPPLAARSSSGVRAYQPSRGDGTLHAWALQKRIGRPFDHPDPQEARA